MEFESKTVVTGDMVLLGFLLKAPELVLHFIYLQHLRWVLHVLLYFPSFLLLQLHYLVQALLFERKQQGEAPGLGEVQLLNKLNYLVVLSVLQFHDQLVDAQSLKLFFQLVLDALTEFGDLVCLLLRRKNVLVTVVV